MYVAVSGGAGVAVRVIKGGDVGADIWAFVVDEKREIRVSEMESWEVQLYLVRWTCSH